MRIKISIFSISENAATANPSLSDLNCEYSEITCLCLGEEVPPRPGAAGQAAAGRGPAAA